MLLKKGSMTRVNAVETKSHISLFTLHLCSFGAEGQYEATSSEAPVGKWAVSMAPPPPRLPPAFTLRGNEWCETSPGSGGSPREAGSSAM